MINQRLFGTPIKGKVRELLERRQGNNTVKIEPGDSTSNQQEPFRMEDKTPFVRMWTAVKLIEPGTLVDVTKEEIENDPNYNMFAQEVGYDYTDALLDVGDTYVEASGTKQSKANREEELKKSFPEHVIVPVKDTRGDTIGYSIKKPRDQIDYVRKIYEVGNHTYQEGYGEVNVNESINVSNPQTSEEDYNEIFPQELKNNKYLKPQAGIKSISVETKGALGVVKETTINFVVHNFKDYDEIYNKYFLKPGATIWVDYGWSNIDYLYRPEELLDEVDDIQKFLYSEGDSSEKNIKEEGFITKNQGNVDVIQGIVSNYSSKILENGSVDCSLTLTSSNNALLGFSLNSDIVSRIKEILQRGILYLGIRQIVSQDDANDEDRDEFQLMTGTPNMDSSATEIDAYEKNMKLLAVRQLSGASAPFGNSIPTGVFVDSMTADNIYIAWGLFEDMIINSQFGFGKSEEDIEESKSMQVTMNSSTSFTKWSDLYIDRQHVLLRVPEDPPVFVYPTVWGGSTDGGDIPGGGSYTYQKGKWPKEDYFQKEKSGLYDPDTPHWLFDKTIHGSDKPGRIPLREVFVNTEIIIKAFESQPTIKKALEEILGKINEDSDGFFNWSILVGDIDSQLKIIDKNYALDDELTDTIVEDEGSHFTFKVMDPQSIVKDYDLSFNMPEGSLGNMYAIQGMSHGNALFTTSGDITTAIATAAIDKDALSIIYEPDLGSLRADQLLNEKNTSESDSIYNTMNEIFDTKAFSVATNKAPNLIPGTKETLTSEDLVPESETTDVQETETESDDLVAKNDRIMELKGFKVSKSFRDYYKIKIVKEVVSKNKPALLPYKMTLTIYGVSSIVPGDTFKVDYLPKSYLDTTYLQVMKVTHDIGPGGWYTTLDTQFRLMPGEINNIQKVDRAKVRLSPTVLNKQSFEEMIQAQDGFFDNTEMSIQDITPFMTDAKVLAQNNGRLDYVIDFKATPKLAGALKDGGWIRGMEGELSHYHTTFYAYFGFRAVEAARAMKQFGFNSVYMANEWYDFASANAIYKTITNMVIGGANSIYENHMFRTGVTGMYYYPPHVRITSGLQYYMLVKGDTFAIVDPRIKDNQGNYMGWNYVKYYNRWIGDNTVEDGWLGLGGENWFGA